MRRLLLVCMFCFQAGAAEEGGVPPDEALKRLADGNARYTAQRTQHPDQSAMRLSETAKGQHPFAIILGCADSRVPPELIFDQGLGDLFVVRVAGNVVDPHVLGSLEYAVEHLGAKLIVVLGHERCGAVQAAVGGGKPEGNVASLVQSIRPALAKAKKEGDAVENAVLANTLYVADQVRSSGPLLNKLVKEGKIKVVGARYDLDDGSVAMLPR